MTQRYFTTLTQVGFAALTNAQALGHSVDITEFAIGDGNREDYDPTLEQLESATALAGERYRGAINRLEVDPQNPARYLLEGIVPVNEGGYTVREAGWFLSDGRLFAVTKFPPSYKTLLSDGAATELPVRTYIVTASQAPLTLKIDPTVVFSTREWVEQQLNAGLKPTLISGETPVLGKMYKKHVYTSAGTLALPDIIPPPGEVPWLCVRVPASVDTRTQRCRLLPPEGKMCEVGGESVTEIVIQESGREFYLDYIDGVWTA